LNLDTKQREMVTVYALLNRIFWISEHGIQFNQNTSTNINWEKVEKGKEVIFQIAKELSIKIG
jgi:hypothetical protein